MKHAQSRSFLLAAALAALVGCDRKPEPQEQGSGGEHDHDHEHEHEAEVHLAPDAIERWGVKVGAVERRVLVRTFRAPARVGLNEDAMAHVGSPVAGRVTDLEVKLGDDAARGETLFTIVSPELGTAQSEFLQKRSAASAAAPAVDLAASAHDRAKALYDDSKGITLTEVQKREADLRVAEAALLAAQTAAQAAENHLRVLGMDDAAIAKLAEGGAVDATYRVLAPISGKVVEREVTLGELVDPARDKLLVLADVSRLWVLADVPESRLKDLAVGARAHVLLGGEGDHRCEGTVAFVSPLLDDATRSVRVRIDVDDKHPELRPGVFAQAEIESASAEAQEPVLAVPEDATQTLENATVVFVPVAGEEGAFRPKPIRAGRAVGGFVPVHSGLAEGERVVVAGSFILKAELGKSSAEHEH